MSSHQTLNPKEDPQRPPGDPSSIRPNEIPVYLQRPSLLLLRTSLINYFSDSPHYVYPARFNAIKPASLKLSDDTWAALKLRVDPLARDILDPHRYYVVAVGVACFVGLVFYAVRPGYDRRKIQMRIGDDDRKSRNGMGRDDDDDVLYDDYFHDDEYERKHALDDVVLAEYEYLNAALDKKILTWRITLAFTLVVLFGTVIFIAVLMERRNAIIDDTICLAIEEIRPRMEDEGIGVEYRTRSRENCIGKYIRPTRVVVFRYLESDGSSGATGRCGGGNEGKAKKKTENFFSDDYQRKYFASKNRRSNDNTAWIETTTNFSLM
ncbi:hypothetical protein ACHAW6_008495 [Cyclotella cf. meneghiniana]